MTDVTVITPINIGSDHNGRFRYAKHRAERRKLLNKNTQTRVDTEMIGTKKNSLNKNMTEMIQHNCCIVYQHIVHVY